MILRPLFFTHASHPISPPSARPEQHEDVFSFFRRFVFFPGIRKSYCICLSPVPPPPKLPFPSTRPDLKPIGSSQGMRRNDFLGIFLRKASPDELLFFRAMMLFSEFDPFSAFSLQVSESPPRSHPPFFPVKGQKSCLFNIFQCQPSG